MKDTMPNVVVDDYDDDDDDVIFNTRHLHFKQ
jgi:hypothetical protein